MTRFLRRLWIGLVLLMIAGLPACQQEDLSLSLNREQLGDPLYADQWHLKNTGQTGGLPGEDIHIEPLWNSCPFGGACRGEGVVISIVDGGVEIRHEDLAQNIVSGNHNYVTGRDDPTPVVSPRSSLEAADLAHGTAIAGLVAARDDNGLGGRGVAPRASLVAFDLLENDTSFNEADSMIREIQKVAISLNSWGAPDGMGQLEPAEMSWQQAIGVGLTQGRQGKGIIYLWAAGNGSLGGSYCRTCVDNSNYDGQANHRGVIAVGAVNDQGKRSSYSERGANVLVSAPGGEYCKDKRRAITTSDLMGDLGFNPNLRKTIDYENQNYTACMNGTSASVPLAGGVVGLALQANPLLTWRDIRWILAKSSRKNDPNDPGTSAFGGDERDKPGWKTNGAGFPINHQYGFGVVDAWAAVQLAKEWKNVGPLRESQAYSAYPNLEIPDDDSTGVSNTIEVKDSSVSQIEWVEVGFSSDHPYSGDLDITLNHDKTGTISRLAEVHDCFSSRFLELDCRSYNGWTFGTVRHLGEAADGSWTLTVRDLKERKVGTFLNWSLKFYGS